MSALDLASGRLPMLITGVGQMVEPHRGGKIRILAVCGGKRSWRRPVVPTLRECGINLSNSTTCGLYGPAAMAPELVRRFAAAARSWPCRGRGRGRWRAACSSRRRPGRSSWRR